MTVTELYQKLEEWLSPELSCDWDNDGLMVCPDGEAEVKRVLLTLDVTAAAADHAAERGFDLIVSHHPLIFRPLKTLSDPRLIALVRSRIAVMSFHTRLDAAAGGVNDALAACLGLSDTERFTAEGIGVIGTLPEPLSPEAFAAKAKTVLGSPKLETIFTDRPCRRVAVVGGDGKDFVGEAALAGADTYLTGSMSYNSMTDAEALGMNLIAAGHFETENPVLRPLADRIDALLGRRACELFFSNRIAVL